MRVWRCRWRRDREAASLSGTWPAPGTVRRRRRRRRSRRIRLTPARTAAEAARQRCCRRPRRPSSWPSAHAAGTWASRGCA